MTRRLIDCVRHSNLDIPQHVAFWELVESKLPEGFLANDGEGGSLWTSAPAPKQPLNLDAGLQLLKEFEGCHLKAYKCPADVWTIGWGSTRHFDGSPVKDGDTITQAVADEMLESTIEFEVLPALRKIPRWDAMSSGQQGALVSFAWNLGWHFYGAEGFETISRRLREREWDKVPDALLLYVNPGSQFEAGLRRRREAEGRLWRGAAAVDVQQQPAKLSPNSPFSARITPHITLGEFALNQEARRFDHQHQVDTAAELAAFMERARVQFGGKPVIITSGYRPPAVNRSVGGASQSEHLYDAPSVGAVDFYIDGVSVKALQDWCDDNWPYSLGYGAPKGFVHLGIREGRPRVRWDY